MRTWWSLEQDPTTNSWSWSERSDDGIVIQRSAGNFPLFMDAFDDARMHGRAGMPSFKLAREPL